MKRSREIYCTGQLPILPGRMFPSAGMARDCSKGDILSPGHGLKWLSRELTKGR